MSPVYHKIPRSQIYKVQSLSTQTSYTNFSFCLFLQQPQGLYDESAYRLLPAECWSPAGARLMTDEELQREYAVVLDALSCSLCSVGSIPQMPTESSREQSCSGIQPPFYQNFHHQSSPATQQSQHQTSFCSGVVQAPGPYNHTAVSESCVDEEEEDMSSWHGISGVPGLGMKKMDSVFDSTLLVQTPIFSKSDSNQSP